MPEVTGLAHTGLTVSDLDRSIGFYRDTLGFEVVMEQEKRGGYLGAIVGYPDAHVRMAHLALPGSAHRIELFEYLEPPSAARTTEPRDVGVTHVCLIVDDLQGLYDRLKSSGGCSFLSAPVDVDTGANRGGAALYLRDPDGILVELFQPPRTA